jgi:transcriptional regulator with XRE-family HTH domain
VDIKTQFDGAKMADDMALRGWMIIDLARLSGLSHKTVSKFLLNQVQTPKSAKLLSHALGYTVRRYLISKSQQERVTS